MILSPTPDHRFRERPGPNDQAGGLGHGRDLGLRLSNRDPITAPRRRTDREPGRARHALRRAGVIAAAIAWLGFAAGTAGAGQSSSSAPAPSSAPTDIPRTSDGHPDFSGVWQVLNTAAWNLQDHHAEKDVPAGRGVVEGNEIPYQAWAAAKKKTNFEQRAVADPESKCYLPGVPRITYQPYPFQILQTPKAVAILYEYVHAMRTVFVDGTSHPAGHIDWWMGDSRGRWEGDTLVVDAVDFNDETWLDRAGNFHSDALHLVERYSFVDRDHLSYEVTIEDPKVFTRPWQIAMPLYRRLEKDIQVLEYECYAFDEQFHGTP